MTDGSCEAVLISLQRTKDAKASSRGAVAHVRSRRQ